MLTDLIIRSFWISVAPVIRARPDEMCVTNAPLASLLGGAAPHRTASFLRRHTPRCLLELIMVRGRMLITWKMSSECKSKS